MKTTHKQNAETRKDVSIISLRRHLPLSLSHSDETDGFFVQLTDMHIDKQYKVMLRNPSTFL